MPPPAVPGRVVGEEADAEAVAGVAAAAVVEAEGEGGEVAAAEAGTAAVALSTVDLGLSDNFNTKVCGVERLPLPLALPLLVPLPLRCSEVGSAAPPSLVLALALLFEVAEAAVVFGRGHKDTHQRVDQAKHKRKMTQERRGYLLRRQNLSG